MREVMEDLCRIARNPWAPGVPVCLYGAGVHVLHSGLVEALKKWSFWLSAACFVLFLLLAWRWWEDEAGP